MAEAGPAADARKTARKIILLGATNSGKSALTTAAEHAADFDLHEFTDFMKITVGASGVGRDLREYADDLVRSAMGMSLPATTAVVPLSFRLEAEFVENEGEVKLRDGRHAKPGDTISCDFDLIDVPGGDANVSMEEGKKRAAEGRKDPERTSAEIDEKVSEANVIFVCAPLTGNESIVDYRESLRDVGTAARPNTELIVVCVTKFDAMFRDKSAMLKVKGKEQKMSHRDMICQRPFSIQEIRKALSKPEYKELCGLLQGAVDNGVMVRVFPVSSFGFLPGDGQANVMRVISEGGDFVAKVAPGEAEDGAFYPIADFRKIWRPFNVLEPLIFAAWGYPSSLSFSWAEVRG